MSLIVKYYLRPVVSTASTTNNGMEDVDGGSIKFRKHRKFRKFRRTMKRNGKKSRKNRRFRV